MVVTKTIPFKSSFKQVFIRNKVGVKASTFLYDCKKFVEFKEIQCCSLSVSDKE